MSFHEGKLSKKREAAKNILINRQKKEINEIKKNNSVDFAELVVIGSKYPPIEIPSLLVNSGHGSYLFNCGAGLTRLCQSSYVKLGRINNVFLTNHRWDHLSGAIGLSIHAQEQAQDSFTIHGNDNLKGFFKSLDSFIIYNTGIVCRERSYREGIFDDGRLQVEAIALDQTRAKSPIDTRQDDSDRAATDIKKSRYEPDLIAYCCRIPDLPGRLDADKCRRMNIPFGPHLKDLKEGKDIKLQDGRYIKSSDVVGEPELGLRFIIIECPTVDDIKRVESNQRLRQLRLLRKSKQAKDDKSIDLVIHLAPSDVTDNPMYERWMNGFAEGCRHLMLCHDEPDRINFIDAYRQQHALRILDSELFPSMYLPKVLSEKVLKEIVEPFRGIDPDNFMETKEADDIPRIRQAISYDHYSLRRKKGLTHPNLAIDMERYLREAREWSPVFDEVVKELHENQRRLTKPQDHEPEVVFLGTSSAMPGKTRNTSGILINFSQPEKFSVILDCGEDTYGQLVRLFGIHRAEQVLKQLRLIYVSHHHADHHVGLIEILRQRAKLTADVINLILPPYIDLLLNYYNKNFQDISQTYSTYVNTNLTTTSSTLPQRNNHVQTIRHELCERMSGLVRSIKLIPVDHCAEATAIVVEFNINHVSMPTWTVAYSGDCRPCKDLIEAGKDCDLLIHEATFDDRAQDHAYSKKHCTTSEAIQVAKDMKAKYTILTHFSQRSSKTPILTDDVDETIGIAYDNMVVRCPTNQKRLHLIKSAINELFRKAIMTQDEYFEKQGRRIRRESKDYA